MDVGALNMANARTFQRSFAGGEVSPEMFGRIEDTHFQAGAAKMRNFIARPQGPAQNRPGFEFVRSVKFPAGKTRLIPFAYSANSAVALELGADVAYTGTNGTIVNGTLQYALADPPANGTYLGYYVYCNGSSGQISTFTSSAGTTTIACSWSPFVPSGSNLTFIIYRGYARIHSDGATVFTGQITNTWSGATNYAIGDLVVRSGGYYYAMQANLNVDPAATGNAGYWYQLPTVANNTTIYEIPLPYAPDDLFDVHYVQSNDVMTLVHPNYYPREIRRYSALSWKTDIVRWVSSADKPATPTITAGSGYRAKIIAWASNAGNSYITLVGTSDFAAGDTVFIKGTGIKAGTSEALDDKFWVVLAKSTSGGSDLLSLRYLDTGAQWSPSSGSASGLNGTIEHAYTLSIPDITNKYKVTAIFADGTESSPSDASTAMINNLYANGASNAISWSAYTGYGTPIIRYNIYKEQSGLYGYIGQTTGTQFADDNIAPDMGKTPPTYGTDLSTVGNYPAAVSYFEQRRAFAGTWTDPAKIWLTQTNTESNLGYSLPIKDTDRIAFQIAARERNFIRHIVPLNQLVLLTNAAEWRVTSVNSDALTPTSIAVRPQSYIGASNVQPSVVNNALVYCAARGGHIRELGYNWQAQSYITGDLSIRAAHLFDGYSIADMTYAKAPNPVLWFVSSSGKLLGLTYIPEEQVGAWHQHDTGNGDVFESCAAVSEGDEDRLYVVVRRTVNGSTVRYIERMSTMAYASLADSFFVDSGLTYNGAPATTIGNLSHLIGRTVAVLADGKVQSRKVVSGAGTITLDTAASKVTVGLPIEADLQTLPVTMQIDGFAQGRYKNINKAWLRVYRSAGIYVGPDTSNLVKSDPYNLPSLQSDEVLVLLTPLWAASGQVFVRQTDPLPLIVVGLTLEVAMGS